MAAEIKVLQYGDEHMLSKVALGLFDNAVDKNLSSEFLADPRPASDDSPIRSGDGAHGRRRLRYGLEFSFALPRAPGRCTRVPRHQGVFPREDLTQIVDGTKEVVGHGPRTIEGVLR